MSALPTWLQWSASLAGASLVAAVYIAGVVAMLRRWHLGAVARRGAIGFGLLLAGSIVTHGFMAVAAILMATSVSIDGYIFWAQIVGAASTLISVAGHLFLLFALRTALRDYERARNAMPASDDRP